MSGTSNISQNQQLEERLSNMHEQMAGVTSRLDQTERALDLERATREDIIEAEVARRMAEAEKRIREKLEAENATRREELDTREAALNKREEKMEQAFELMEQKVLADARHHRIAFPGETTEFLLPAMSSYYVQPYRRPVIVRKDDINDHTIVADAVEGPIWKSYASSEMLSRIEVRKFGFHMPFWRQIQEMKMCGLPISRSTINDWHKDVCDMVKPLYDLQDQRVFSDLYIAADGCPMPVVDNEKHRTVKQYIISYRSITTGIPIFKTTPGEGCGRGKEVIKAQMANWNGLALMCDAYAGYDWVKKLGRILCRCAAHARRDMERALKECPAKAKIGMLMYQEIYAVEEIIKHDKLKGADIVVTRNNLARPLWQNLRLWCMSEILEHDEQSLMHKALGYVIRHYDELTAYLDIAEMPLDNTDTERQIRAMVMGKQAYLFCQTMESCERAAIMYSLIGACKVLGKNPEKWLTYVLKNIKTTKPEDLHKLLPEEWEEQ